MEQGRRGEREAGGEGGCKATMPDPAVIARQRREAKSGIPEKYNTQDASGLTAEVKAESEHDRLPARRLIAQSARLRSPHPESSRVVRLVPTSVRGGRSASMRVPTGPTAACRSQAGNPQVASVSWELVDAFGPERWTRFPLAITCRLRAGSFAALAFSLRSLRLVPVRRPSPAGPPVPASAAATAAEARPTEFLEKVWPGYPEWLAMLAEILAGNQIDPDAGWFKKGAARSRFDWATVRDRFDRDRDGKVARGEFPGTGRRLQAARPRRRWQRSRRSTSASARRTPTASPRRRRIQPRRVPTRRPERGRQGDGGRAQAVPATASASPRPTTDPRQRPPELRSGDDSRPPGERASDFLVLSDFQEAFDAGREAEDPPRTADGAAFMQRPASPRRPCCVASSAATSARGGPAPNWNALAPDFTLETSDGRSKVTLSKLARDQARGPHLRQSHLRRPPLPRREPRDAPAPLRRACPFRAGLHARVPPGRRLGAGREPDGPDRPAAAARLSRAGRRRAVVSMLVRPGLPRRWSTPWTTRSATCTAGCPSACT